MIGRRRDLAWLGTAIGVLAASLSPTAAAAVLVAHVPAAARTAPPDAVVHLIALAADVATSASGTDEYPWFSAALVPTGADVVTITAPGTTR